MEGAFTWEYQTLINELTQGMEKAKELHLHLCSASPSEPQHLLLQRILSSYEKALSIVNWKGSAAVAAPESGSISVDGSPRSEELRKNFNDNKDYSPSKKRKLQPTWTEQVRVNPENGHEGPTDDGYSWRKYGQKDILGAKHPRSYYRCTYRLIQDCWATKQVQRSDDDPTIFEITYRGTHTCNQSTNVVPAPASPEKQDSKHISNYINNLPQQQNQALLDFKANLRVSTEDLDSKEMHMPLQFSFPSTNEGYYFPISSALVGENHYSPQFLSPATSETNYFSPAAYGVKSYGGNPNYQHSESDIAEIISAHASTTNSPIGAMEFPFDPVELDPNFPFNASGFFT